MLSTLLIAGGLGALGCLNASDWYAQYQADRHISRIEGTYADQNDPRRLECKRQAQLYNDALAGERDGANVWDYARQLLYEDEPMMSYIEIPRIAVRLPIYHGTEENVLMAGVGHLAETSLPIGGNTSHCVLAGHSGMRNTRMFDDLQRLKPGDVFVIRTLGEPYAYEVYDSEVVLPEEAAGRLALQPGCDLVTLMTCTPYGVNTHRLLVHGKRCPYVAEAVEEVGSHAYVNDRNLAFLVAMGVLAVWLLSSFAIRRFRRFSSRASAHAARGGGGCVGVAERNGKL